MNLISLSSFWVRHKGFRSLWFGKHRARSSLFHSPPPKSLRGGVKKRADWIWRHSYLSIKNRRSKKKNHRQAINDIYIYIYIYIWHMTTYVTYYYIWHIIDIWLQVKLSKIASCISWFLSACHITNRSYIGQCPQRPHLRHRRRLHNNVGQCMGSHAVL